MPISPGVVEESCDVLLIQPPVRGPEFVSKLSGTLYMPRRLVKACINPGILSLGSYILHKGHSARILDLAEGDALLRVGLESMKKAPRLVGIGCTSAFEYLGTLRCAQECKQCWPDVPVIVGGQHVGPLGTMVLEDAPHIDFVCLYEGEVVLEQLLEQLIDGKLACEVIQGLAYRINHTTAANREIPKVVPLDEMPLLQYDMYPDFRRYTPYVEESRGCPYGCVYCISNYLHRRRIRLKSPRRIARELEHARSLWGDIPEYALLASTFGVRSSHVLELADRISGLGIRWNTEIRPECHWERWLPQLQNSGLRVLNFGVESGSKEILSLMKRTDLPDEFLDRVVDLLHFSKDLGLRTRCNFIVYAGDTLQTLKETLEFIVKAGPHMDAIEYSPLFVVPGTQLERDFPRLSEQLGCSLVKGDYWEQVHLHPCHPSKEVSFDEAVGFAALIERMFSSPEGWYEAEKTMYTQKDHIAMERVKNVLMTARFADSGDTVEAD